MKRSVRGLVMMLSALAGAAAADAQQISDPRVADLVRTGRIRVAVCPPMYTKNPATGEIGGMQIDLARALAARLGVEALPVDAQVAPPGNPKAQK